MRRVQSPVAGGDVGTGRVQCVALFGGSNFWCLLPSTGSVAGRAHHSRECVPATMHEHGGAAFLPPGDPVRAREIEVVAGGESLRALLALHPRNLATARDVFFLTVRSFSGLCEESVLAGNRSDFWLLMRRHNIRTALRPAWDQIDCADARMGSIDLCMHFSATHLSCA